MWMAWHRPEHAEAWTAVLSAADERLAISAANEARLGGDVLVLPAGVDPNNPARQQNGTGWHNDGTTGRRAEAAAVIRGRWNQRLREGRRT